MAYCIYLRKSRADAEAEALGELETLARHEAILLGLAHKLNLTITEIYREIVSGETISARPVMQLLLNEIENQKWEGVLVMEVERLARGDTIDQGTVAQTFKYGNTKIITPIKTYDPNNEFDEEYFEFGLFMSRREYKTINRRLQKGRLTSIKEGKFLGNKTPYGYKKVKLENQKGYTLEIIPEEAEVIKTIFYYYSGIESDQRGINAIVRYLNELKIKPKYNYTWSNATIRGMLENPVYIGKIRWNHRPQKKIIVDGKIQYIRPRVKLEECVLTDGLHKPIIDIDTWDQAQKMLSENKSAPCPKDFKIKNPLRGIIYCGLCGHSMVRRPQKNYPDSLICAYTSCKNVSSHLYLVEDHLLKHINNWFNDYKVTIKNSSPNEPNNLKEDSLKKLHEERKKLQEQNNKIHELLESNVYSVEMFLDRSKVISENIKKNEENIKSFERIISSDISNKTSKVIILNKTENLLNIYNQISDAEIKNTLLKEIIDKVYYTKNESGRWNNEIDNFTLEIFMKIPKEN